MKKLFLFITILLASYNLGAQEDFHLEGAISKSYGYLSLTTAERDALGLGLNDRKTIWNSTDDELQYWTGISWICQSCVGTTTLQASIAADPDATSKPNFQGGIDVGLDNGSPAIVTLKGGTGGSANLTIASTVAGAVLAHSAGISFTAPSLIVNGDPVSHFYEDGYNASTDDLSLSDGDSKPNGWETFVTVAGSHDFGSGAISLGVNDVIQKIDGVYRKKVDNNQSGGGGSIVHDDNEIVVGTGAGTETFDNFTFDGTVFKLSSDPAELNSSFYFKKNETASGSNISHLSVIEKDSGIGNYSGHGILQDHNVTANATSNGASALYTQNDKEGTGDLLYFYSQEVYTNHKSDSDIGFLNGITLGVTVEGLNSTVSTGVRGISPTVNLESPTSVITGYVQGIHPTINLDNGTLNGNSDILFLDYDWDGTNYTHNGNLSYIRATDDNSIENLTTSGWKRFISYEGNLNSYFGGSLTVGGNYTLPAVDGTNGQVLKTDGSGILTWQDDDDSGGGSLPARVGFAARSSNTNVPATTFTRVVFGNEIEDTNSAWDGSVFTVPVGEGGMYEIFGHATFTSVTDGNIAVVGVEINGSLSNGGLLGRGTSGGTGLNGYGGALRLNLSAGDEVEMIVYCQNGTSLYNTSQLGYCTFSAYKMR